MTTIGSIAHQVPSDSPTSPSAASGPSVGFPAAPGGEPSRRIVTPCGLPGFPGARSFRLDPVPGLESSFMVLRATDTESLGFVVLAAGDGASVYGPTDLAEIRAALGAGAGDLQLLLLVTMASEPSGFRAFVNLRAPLAIDTGRRIAAQIVLSNPSYPLRHPLEPRTAEVAA